MGCGVPASHSYRKRPIRQKPDQSSSKWSNARGRCESGLRRAGTSCKNPTRFWLLSQTQLCVFRATGGCKGCREGCAQKPDPDLGGASATTPMGCRPAVCRIFPTAAACHSPTQWRRNFAVQFVRNSRNHGLGKIGKVPGLSQLAEFVFAKLLFGERDQIARIPANSRGQGGVASDPCLQRMRIWIILDPI